MASVSGLNPHLGQQPDNGTLSREQPGLFRRATKAAQEGWDSLKGTLSRALSTERLCPEKTEPLPIMDISIVPAQPQSVSIPLTCRIDWCEKTWELSTTIELDHEATEEEKAAFQRKFAQDGAELLDLIRQQHNDLPTYKEFKIFTPSEEKQELQIEIPQKQLVLIPLEESTAQKFASYPKTFSVVQLPVGIRWEKNNCFLAAPLHLFANNPIIRDAILETEEDELTRILKQYKEQQEQKKHEPISPTALQEAYQEHRLGTPEDTIEFVIQMLQKRKYPANSPLQATYSDGNKGIPLLTLNMGDNLNFPSLVEESFSFEEAPQTLLIQVGRHKFENGQGKEDARPLQSVPLQLSVKESRYTLQGFLVHKGGHFVSYIKVGELYFFCNGTEKRVLAEKDFLNAAHDAYFLSYNKFR